MRRDTTNTQTAGTSPADRVEASAGDPGRCGRRHGGAAFETAYEGPASKTDAPAPGSRAPGFPPDRVGAGAVRPASPNPPAGRAAPLEYDEATEPGVTGRGFVLAAIIIGGLLASALTIEAPPWP